MAEVVAAVLVLLTGLPASGKSSFLAELQHRLGGPDNDSFFPVFGVAGLQGQLTTVLQLDEILAELTAQRVLSEAPTHSVATSAATETTPPAFSPEHWKAASDVLYQRTEEALRECLRAFASRTGNPAPVPFVVVEDNMHLRSMRERYHRLCRRLEDEVAGDFVVGSHSGTSQLLAVVELRFTTEASVCVERNQHRRHGSRSQEETAGSTRQQPLLPPVPDQVILAMAAVFDDCHDTTAATAGGGDGGWKWTPTTQPWSLLELSPTAAVSLGSATTASAESTSYPSTAALVDDFFETVVQTPLLLACREQYERVHRRRQRLLAQKREEEEAGCDAVATRSAPADVLRAHAHALDLQLRAVAHAFLCDRRAAPAEAARPPTPIPAEFGKRVAKLKKEALQRFHDGTRRARSGNREKGSAGAECSLDVDEAAALHEACLTEFQDAVRLLLQPGCSEAKGVTRSLRNASPKETRKHGKPSRLS